MSEFNLPNALPQIGFGTYLIPNDKAAIAVSTALELGYRHVDTAEGYRNEGGVGSAISAAKKSLGLSRSDIFVTTKLWPGNPEWGMETKDYNETVISLDNSLKKLGLDYVDLYLIHAPFALTDRIEQWRACCDQKKAGKVRFVGVSNYSEPHIAEIVSSGLPIPDANQIELHPWCQKPDLNNFLKKNNIDAIAYSSLMPLANWRDKPGQDSAKSNKLRKDGAASNSPFKTMATRYAVTEAQLLLRWGLQKGYPILPKTVSPERMKENFDLKGFIIDQQDMNSLDAMDRGNGVAWRSGDPCNSA